MTGAARQAGTLRRGSPPFGNGWVTLETLVCCGITSNRKRGADWDPRSLRRRWMRRSRTSATRFASFSASARCRSSPRLRYAALSPTSTRRLRWYLITAGPDGNLWFSGLTPRRSAASCPRRRSPSSPPASGRSRAGRSGVGRGRQRLVRRQLGRYELCLTTQQFHVSVK